MDTGVRQMHKAKVYVKLRESILDPEGSAVQGSLQKLGFSEVKNVRIGKMIELEVDRTQGKGIESRIEEMCRMLLVNEVIEDFYYETEDLS